MAVKSGMYMQPRVSCNTVSGILKITVYKLMYEMTAYNHEQHCSRI